MKNIVDTIFFTPDVCAAKEEGDGSVSPFPRETGDTEPSPVSSLISKSIYERGMLPFRQLAFRLSACLPEREHIRITSASLFHVFLTKI